MVGSRRPKQLGISRFRFFWGGFRHHKATTPTSPELTWLGVLLSAGLVGKSLNTSLNLNKVYG